MKQCFLSMQMMNGLSSKTIFLQKATIDLIWGLCLKIHTCFFADVYSTLL